MHHNWSGWPGAWCLNCGIGDPYEQSLADDCQECHWEPDFDHDFTAEFIPCEKHLARECLGPKDGHNPYGREGLDDAAGEPLLPEESQDS